MFTDLAYDPETGHFWWLRRTKTSSRRKLDQPAGRVHVDGYREIKINGRNYKAHRLAWLYTYGKWPCHEVDHINFNRDDNRIANLRQATRSQNGANLRRPSTNTSGFKGVSFRKQLGLWEAYIRRGTQRHLGFFKTPEEAHAAYCAAAAQYDGEFLNPG